MQISNTQTIFLFTSTLLGVLVAVTIHIPLVLGLLPGFFYLLFLAKSNGLSASQITVVCKLGIKKTSSVIYILFLVGLLLPAWHLSGTIDQMIALSLQLINVNHFIVSTFIIAILFSMILGTSVGTLSSIGIPIIGCAITLDIPLDIVAGALISGAFVGDRTSPFSSAHQLLANTVEIKVSEQFKAMAKTTLIAILVGLIFYSYFDEKLLSDKNILMVQQSVSFTIYRFLPPVILVVFVFLQFRIIYAFLASIGIAIGISLITGVEINNLLTALWFGIEGVGGGLVNMYMLLLFIALAGAYNGLLEKLNVFRNIVEKWLKSSASIFDDTNKVILASLGISLITANQTLPIILTGRTFITHWSNRYSKPELAR